MSDLELAGRVAVITGGTRGAGKALAEFFWTHRFGDPLLSAETFRLAPLGTLA